MVWNENEKSEGLQFEPGTGRSAEIRLGNGSDSRFENICFFSRFVRFHARGFNILKLLIELTICG